MAPDKDKNGKPFALSGVSVNKFVGDFVKEQVDNYLHKHLDVAEVMQQKIQESEKERKAIAGVTKLARERAKKGQPPQQKAARLPRAPQRCAAQTQARAG